MLRLLLFLALLLPATATAQRVAVGAGGYGTALPTGQRSLTNEHGSPVTPYVTDRVAGPVPTNTWWSSLLFKYRVDNFWSSPLFPHPLAVQAYRDGLGIAYPNTPEITADGEHYRYLYAEDFRVGLGGRNDGEAFTGGMNSPATWVDGYSDWTVTALWEDTATSRTLRATFGHGLPFVYFERNADADATATLADGREATIWHDADGTLAFSIGDRHYALFAPAGTWQREGDTFASDLGGEDVFAVAVLPDDTAATLATFAARAFAFVTDTRVDWRYDEATATVVTDFAVTTEARAGTADTAPLLALYRHQWLNTDAALTDWTYVSPRGTMKLLDGAAFTTRMRFQGLLPNFPLPPNADPDLLADWVDEVRAEDKLIPRPGSNDTYWTGKAMTRVASLLPLADQVGGATSKALLLAQLRARVKDWLNYTEGETTEFFYYDDTWSTLIGFPVGFGSNTDLNDHHFHYGYFLDAAATLARFDHTFAADWGAMVNLIVRDVASPDRADPMFPFLRHFDPYAGHSWASGHGAFERGNNQESSSEALHFARSLMQWGAETGDTALRDLGIWLFRTEREAVQQYWFDVDDAVFPLAYEHTTLGTLWGNGGHYGTFFSNDAAPIHGINFLPITAGALYLGYRPEYVAANYSEVAHRTNGRFGYWTPIINSFRALAAPGTAFDDFEADPNADEYGTTKAFLYHWLATLAHYGLPVTDVTADTPTAVVLGTDAGHSYLAYNPGIAPLTVTFSDGKTLSVPPGDVVVSAAGTPNEHDALAHATGFTAIDPHPVANRAAIGYHLARPQHVRLDVFDVQGRRVRRLVNGHRSAGGHTALLDATDLPSGVYHVRLTTASSILTRPLVRIR